MTVDFKLFICSISCFCFELLNKSIVLLWFMLLSCFLIITKGEKLGRIWQLYLIWISVMSYHHIVVCLLQACSKFAGKHVNVYSKLAARFAASLQEAFHIGACEHLQQANSKPNLHGKMFAANMQHIWMLLCYIINICCRQAAMIAGDMQ